MFSVITANVNGVRAAARRGGLVWLRRQRADVLCLQEVRASTEQLNEVIGAELNTTGTRWHVAHAPGTDAGRGGVAVLSRAEPTEVRVGLLGFANAGRWLEVDLAGPFGPLTVVSAYVFTGEADTPRQVEKYAFLDAMTRRLAQLADRDAVITGDFNIAHREADLKNWRGNLKRAGFLVDERAYLDRWLASGWHDLLRRHAGDGPGPYTWWSWRGRAFDRDTGWRIDYLLASESLAARSVKIDIGRAASYAQRWSDHAAVTAWFG